MAEPKSCGVGVNHLSQKVRPTRLKKCKLLKLIAKFVWEMRKLIGRQTSWRNKLATNSAGSSAHCALWPIINGQVVSRKKPQTKLPKNKAFSFCAFLREESKRPRDKAEKESHYHALQPGNQGLKG